MQLKRDPIQNALLQVLWFILEILLKLVVRLWETFMGLFIFSFNKSSLDHSAFIPLNDLFGGRAACLSNGQPNGVPLDF